MYYNYLTAISQLSTITLLKQTLSFTCHSGYILSFSKRKKKTWVYFVAQLVKHSVNEAIVITLIFILGS